MVLVVQVCIQTVADQQALVKLIMFPFLLKSVHFIKKKMQFCVCFLNMFRPLKG